MYRAVRLQTIGSLVRVVRIYQCWEVIGAPTTEL